MKKHVLYLLIFGLFVFSRCSMQPAKPEITIFAAASLTEAFNFLTLGFSGQHPEITVSISYSGSQTLRTQILEGAQADVFASANLKHMDDLIAARLVEPDHSQVFVTNQIVVVLPADNPADVRTLESLATPGLKLVMAAPEVPVGSYSLDVLSALNGLYDPTYQARVLANLVSSEENVKQVIAKVQLGEVDAGMVYRSDAVAAPELIVLPIPEEYNITAEYAIAPLTAAPHPDLAEAFLEYVLSSKGQAILERWGFTPVRP
ncbi:MAG: molybdate ABC transporter substrate-binding protein [Chloroflexi bacterium]|nr:MAG: molybdate ABC transporter substrate-binding protein [Chloroflexota bacterium]MBL1194610.1 molybdate ABC transporter substrate-binding protein [Chloroflexota bacterium]NOH11900.1 molybdate ABC transporter substrate-binding protein [Chloroflexota bacterium]